MAGVNLTRTNLLLFAALFTLSLSSCHVLQMRYSDSAVYNHYHKRGLHPEIRYYTAMGRAIRYFSLGNDSLPTTLLIHGAPSSLSVFDKVMTDTSLLRVTKIYAVDRPGYGYSGFGNSETSIEKQAQSIIPILEQLRNSRRPVVVMGVSFGGPIAARIAMLRPDLVDGLVLGAPAIAPGEEKVYSISYTIRSKWVRWLIPRMLRVATDEKLQHEEELCKMMPDWPKIRVPVIYMQGLKDELIYTSNSEFAKQMLVNVPSLEVIMIPRQPHFLSYPQKDLIVRCLKKMVGMVNVDYADQAPETRSRPAAAPVSPFIGD